MLSWTTSLFALSASTLTLFTQGAQEPQSLSQETVPTLRIYGGEITKTCEFPQTVQVGGCTGTLIHPQVVLSAAHCGALRSASFGEHSRSKVAKRVNFKWCERSTSGGRDAQICVLNEPMKGVPVVPIIQGCEMEEIKKGAKVLLAGFGYDENDPSGGSPGGEKRWVETDIRLVKSNLDIHIGGDGKGGCNGDSGGPAFLQMKDGTWRTIGATHAGATSPGSHPNCDTGIWKSTGKLLKWYEEMLAKHNESGIDLSPCFDDQGKWAPTEACGGYVKDLKGPFGSWSDGCGKDAPVVKYSATCGEPFAPNDEEDPGDKEDPDKGSITFSSPGEGAKLAPDSPIKVKVKLDGLKDVKDVMLMVDGKETEADDSAPYAWTLDPLEPGDHKLKAVARDDDDKTLASTKELSFTVVEAGEEPDPTPDETETQGDDSGEDEDTGDDGDEKDSNEDSGDGGGDSGDDSGEDSEGDSEGKEDSDNFNVDDEKGKKKKGCSVNESDSPWAPAAFALFLGWMGWTRRSRSKLAE